MNIDEMEWQLVGEDNWTFGPKVRGLVRPVGEIYFDEDKPVGWRWMTFVGDRAGGYEHVFQFAVKEVEDYVKRVKEQPCE